MIIDNNFAGNLQFAKDVLMEVSKLKFWALGIQFSIECLRDDEFVELLTKANCRMAFIGVESLNTRSLNAVEKKQNIVDDYKNVFQKLNQKGIISFAGIMFALEEDTKDYYELLPDLLDEIGVSVILPSIAIPIYGTPLYEYYLNENRITDFNISHYDGDHLVFKHKLLSKDEIFDAYKNVNKKFYSSFMILKRWRKIIAMQRVENNFGKFLMKLIIITLMYFKLSYFQRHHARMRVFKKIK
jgi:radical SAM superfamily enzyme YgiQ (UPF0313 family)